MGLLGSEAPTAPTPTCQSHETGDISAKVCVSKAEMRRQVTEEWDHNLQGVTLAKLMGERCESENQITSGNENFLQKQDPHKPHCSELFPNHTSVEGRHKCKTTVKGGWTPLQDQNLGSKITKRIQKNVRDQKMFHPESLHSTSFNDPKKRFRQIWQQGLPLFLACLPNLTQTARSG